MKRHPHPLWLWYHLRRFWPLLFIPAARLLYARVTGEAPAGLGRDGVAALLLIGGAVWLWRTTHYAADARGAVLWEGIWRRERRVFLSRVTAVGIVRTPLMGLCRARRVWLYAAGRRKGTGFSLYLDRESAQRFGVRRACPCRIRRFWPTLVLSLSGSNAVVGLLTAILPLRHAARLWGEWAAAELVTLADRFILLNLPPAFKALVLCLLAGWTVAFVRNLLRYAGFSVETEGEELCLRGGVFTRRNIRFSRREVMAVLLRQTLPMGLLRLYSASAALAGRGRTESVRPVLVPAAGERALSRELYRLFPGRRTPGAFHHPPRAGQRRYLWAPFLWLTAGAILPFGGSLWRPLAGFWLAAAGWWYAVRLWGCRAAGCVATEDYLLLRYPRGLALYTAVIPRGAVEAVELCQSPWQRQSGLCTVVVSTGGGRHRLWGLRRATVKAELFRDGENENNLISI